MNNEYYQSSIIPNNNIPNQYSGSIPYNNQIRQTNPSSDNNMLYSPNDPNTILERNIGKMAKFYMSFTDSNEWRDKTFEGIIEQAGRQHAIISDPKTGKWTLIVLIYLNYIEFLEPINLPKR